MGRMILLLCAVVFCADVVFGGDGLTTYHAVICGISDYDGSVNDLDYCDDDAQDIYDKLLESAHWTAGNMQLLKDAQATETNIHTAIQIMAGNADSDDMCLFFFSGHGGQREVGYDDPLDVPPVDESDGADEYLCPYYLWDNQILDDELSAWLDNLATDMVVVWIDACHSGGNLKGTLGCAIKSISRGTVGAGDGFISDFKLRRMDVDDLTAPYISTACDDDEYSIEDPYLQQGLYTYYLLEALDNADTNANGWVSGEESFDYLYPKVVAYESTQHPQEYDAYPGQADVVKNGGGGDAPVITITNPTVPSISVNYSNASIGVSGSCSTSVVGQLSWTNSLTGSNGVLTAAVTWSLSAVALDVGTNVITVAGTNNAGSAASDSVTVRRRTAASGNVLLDEHFDQSTDVPSGWVNGGTANDTGAGHVQSSPNCRAFGPSDTLETPSINHPSELSFYVDSSGGGAGQVASVDYRTGGGSWIELGSFTVVVAGVTETYDLTGSPNLSGTEDVEFRFNSTFYTWYLDDVLVLGSVASNLPGVTITNPVTGTVSNSIASVDLYGTVNTNVAGQLTWTNSLTGVSGTQASSLSWFITNVALNVGANTITVSATNAAGAQANDSITLTRQSLASGGLFISEVADPGDVPNAKFVELYNGGVGDVNFDTQTWYICRQANGSSWGDLQLAGMITAGTTHVVAYNQTDFEASYGFSANQYSGHISGNGNDGYFLYKDGNHAVGILVDAYGVIDQDGTGEAWEYGDSHAVRKANILNPNTTWTSSEWTIAAAGTADMTPASIR